VEGVRDVSRETLSVPQHPPITADSNGARIVAPLAQPMAAARSSIRFTMSKTIPQSPTGTATSAARCFTVKPARLPYPDPTHPLIPTKVGTQAGARPSHRAGRLAAHALAAPRRRESCLGPDLRRDERDCGVCGQAPMLRARRRALGGRIFRGPDQVKDRDRGAADPGSSRDRYTLRPHPQGVGSHGSAQPWGIRHGSGLD
jgi:hypothetical protein